MICTILRRLGLLPGLLLLLGLGMAHPALATHLLGGEMTYKYLDANGPSTAPLRYEITMSIYNNCNTGSAAPVASVAIAIYSQATGAQVVLNSTNFAGTITAGRMVIPYTTSTGCIQVSVPPGCPNTGASQQPFDYRKYIGVVNLPAAPAGYYAYWTAGARNLTITNLLTPGSASMVLYTALAPATYTNHSPVFATDAIAVLCANDTTTLLNNAVDTDGDRLEYSFGQPYGVYTGALYPGTFTPPPATVTYAAGYSATAPLGASPNAATINIGTGIAKFYATTLGAQYVVAVDVKEYRKINGVDVLLGTTRRDLQLVVGTCPPTAPPILPTTGTSSTPIPRNYTVEAGSTLTIPITTTQSGGHDLDMTATSVLLDGNGGYTATFAGDAGTPTYAGSPLGTVTVSGTGGTVSGTFVYTPACNEARVSPYDITLTVFDKGCGGKTTADVLHITVTKPTGPTAIAGDAAICGLNTTRSYTASGGTSPVINWRLSGGGSFVGSNTANPVQVLWTTAGTFTLTARGVSQYGCFTDSVTKTVVVSPSSILTVTGNQAICQGQSTTLTVAGAAPYTVVGGPTTLTGAGPFTLTPAQTTVYTITGTGVGMGCTPSTQVTVTVSPTPTATTGPAVTYCSGSSAQLGAAPVAGITYSWSPATGLSDPTVANPTVTLANATSTPITLTYTLTVVNATNCSATGTVAVTVNPVPPAAPPAAVAFCSGGSAQLGAPPVAGNNTYSWSPTTGLSSPVAANPTLTLTNTTGVAIIQTYTLTISNTLGCSSTSTTTVTVNPMPVAVPGAAVALCSGSSASLGAASVAGNTYSWSPATGLSSSTVANPTVTLTNTTGSPFTQTYTLTVTNATNCVSTGTVVVTVNPVPTAVPGAAVVFCSGGSASLGAAPVAGLSYSWSPTTGLSNATVANPTVTLTNTTGAPVTQTYTLTTTGAGNCSATGTVAVTVNPLPPLTLSPTLALCSGTPAQLGSAPVAGFTYSWSPATGLSSATVANPTITLNNTTGAPITQTYTLTVTNPTTRCVSTGTVAVTVNFFPVANAGSAVTICSGSSAQLGTTPVAGLNYNWSPATGLSSSTVANPTVLLINTTGANTTQVYTLTVTNASICSTTSTVAVTVVPLPAVVPGAAVTFCSGNTTTLGAAPVAGLTYSWSPATGLSNTAIANPSLTLTNATGVAITPTYTLTVTNAATGCTNTGTVVVTVNSEILPGIVGPSQTVCASSTPLPLTSTPGPSGGYGTYAYQWESSPDNITWTPIANATSATYAPGPLAATTYYRRRVASGSCADAVSNAVMLELVPQLVSGVTLATPPTQCAGLPITFTPTATNVGGSPSFRWFINNVPVASGPTFTSTTLTNGDVVRVEVTPTPGFCATSLAIASVTVNLTLVAQPTVVVRTTTALPICAGSPATFVIDNTTNAGTAPTYQWQVNGMNVAGATSATFTSTTLTDGQVVTLVLSTPSPCGVLAATSNGLTIGVNPYVSVNAGPDKTIMEGETTQLEGTASGTFPVTWTPNLGFSFSSNNPLRPLVAPLVTTTYTLAAQVGACYSESKVTITVTPKVRIPNAFTPNGDGNDDTWQIDRIGDYASNHVTVFNRWGAKIFETTNYNHGNEWNGTVNGQTLPIGTYYYLITLGNGKSYTGPLTVLY